MAPDAVTRRWIRNRSDELAAANGCRFDEERARHIVEFCQSELILYEGEAAGQPMILGDWQLDVLQRVFGWVTWSEDWQREVRRYRKASIWVPKKNGKSPTAAAVGLYLLARDGEQGQKIYTAARDGLQAGIVHRHAVEMVKRSPTLSGECSIMAEAGRKKEVGRIIHEATSSFYTILAGDNIDSQEGLNGSCIIDEKHVVDARLAAVLKYMGASRSEPLEFGVSTAGKNPEGYGKKDYDYGREVESGKFDNQAFFHAAWEAPQDASDEQCLSPDVWEAANPTWNRIIREGEFRASAAEARKSPTDWATFKMYRLNIWQKSLSPWIAASDWDACRRDFTPERFRGQPCWMGLDLSKTNDMTAAVFLWKGDTVDEVWQWPLFFLPRDVARDKNHLASYVDWAAAGHLHLTSGNVVDFVEVRQALEQFAADYDLDVQSILFDRKYAEEITQILVESWACEREDITQSRPNLTPRIDDYERLILAHRLYHPGHPILDWQAGHVSCDLKPNGKLLVKPENDDHKKIDGISAGVNAVTDALNAEIYDSGGPLFV